MGRRVSIVLGLMAASLMADAAEASSRGRQVASIPPASAAAVLAKSKMPIGWADFCARYADECAVSPAPAADVTLTAQAWRTLVAVNAKVNREIEPVTDVDHWGLAERWDYPSDGRGDCEDYVLLKRKLLMEAGFPRQALLATVVIDHKGDGHAVLTVKTDRGDFVLDNQIGAVLPWTQTGYRFVKRQSQEDPNVWVSLGAPVAPAATASR